MPFVDADSIAHDAIIDTDICIIGSGAAGIMLASEFLNTSTRVCILESGSHKPSPVPDAHYAIASSRLPVSPDSRRRGFGGTMNVWSGRWKELDDIDFRVRPWVRYSGWPITREELQPYYERAASACDIPSSAHSNRHLLESTRIVPAIFRSQPEHKRIWGQSWKNSFIQSKTVTVYTNAHVTRIETTNGLATDIRVQTPAGQSLRVRASRVIIAAGGIENARLLLLSSIGNEHDQVGRYYMDHPKNRAGVIETYHNIHIAGYADCLPITSPVFTGYRLSDEEQEQHGLLNSHIFFEPLRNRFPHKHLWNYVRPSTHTHALSIRNYLEQEPNPSQRITLSEIPDVFGLPVANIEWTLSEQEQKTIAHFHKVLAVETQRSDVGELDSPLLTENPDNSGF